MGVSTEIVDLECVLALESWLPPLFVELKFLPLSDWDKLKWDFTNSQNGEYSSFLNIFTKN